MGRGLTILLVASVLLNIFGVGFISGRLLDREPAQPPQQMRFVGKDNPFRLMRHAHSLPPEKREVFRDVIKTGLPTARQNHETVRRLQRELSELFASDELDNAAITTKMAEIRKEHARQREIFDVILVEAMATLSAQERRSLIEASADQRQRYRKRRGRFGGHDRPPSPEEGPEEPERD